MIEQKRLELDKIDWEKPIYSEYTFADEYKENKIFAKRKTVYNASYFEFSAASDNKEQRDKLFKWMDKIELVEKK